MKCVLNQNALNTFLKNFKKHCNIFVKGFFSKTNIYCYCIRKVFTGTEENLIKLQTVNCRKLYKGTNMMMKLFTSQLFKPCFSEPVHVPRIPLWADCRASVQDYRGCVQVEVASSVVIKEFSLPLSHLYPLNSLVLVPILIIIYIVSSKACYLIISQVPEVSGRKADLVKRRGGRRRGHQKLDR